MARDQDRIRGRVLIIAALIFGSIAICGLYGYRAVIATFGKMLVKNETTELPPVQFEFYTTLPKQRVIDTHPLAANTTHRAPTKIPIADHAELERQLSDMVNEKRAK